MIASFDSKYEVLVREAVELIESKYINLWKFIKSLKVEEVKGSILFVSIEAEKQHQGNLFLAADLVTAYIYGYIDAKISLSDTAVL